MPDETTQPVADPTVSKVTDTQKDPAALNKEIADGLKTRVDSNERERKTRRHAWKRNIDLRIGHANTLYPNSVRSEDDIQSEINPDWSLTKTKTANLFSQVPAVQGTHENKQYAAAVSPFIKQLNYELGEKRANIGVPMEEVLNDTVNAAGVGAIMVGYAARFETVDMPVIDVSQHPPEIVEKMIASGEIPTAPKERVTDDKFFGLRISPNDFIWPTEFTGSNFDDGDFVGRRGRCSWSEGKVDFKLKDEQKELVLSGGDVDATETLRSEPEKAGLADAKSIVYDELYYWRYRVDPDEKSFKAIWKIIYVQGLPDPVIHEPWRGQKYISETRKYVGSCKFPIRVLTLTYITDNPIPPSDSAAGRPQVNDMRRSRSQMFMNRDRSVPIRWFDVNRVDSEIQASLMRGDWQGMIPTNGDGSRTIGEIARASYPSEDITFDQATKADLMETWQIGPNQGGMISKGGTTAAESNNTAQGFATRIGQERARVAAFFLGVCEVMAGWLALYSDFPVLTQEEREAMMKAWDSKQILHDLVLKIRPDAAIVLDTETQINRAMRVLNMTAQSGYLNPKPLISQIVEWSGFDPAECVIDPQPPQPEDANISYRFSGKDDLMNPLVVAMLVKLKKAPTPEELDMAKKILESVQMPSQPTPSAGSAPPAASSQSEAQGGPGAPASSSSDAGGSPGQPQPQGDAHPEWSLMSKIAARSRDAGAGNAGGSEE